MTNSPKPKPSFWDEMGTPADPKHRQVRYRGDDGAERESIDPEVVKQIDQERARNDEKREA